MRILVATIKSWNIRNALILKHKYEGVHNIELITESKELTHDRVKKFAPDFIFFPHWSYYIPEDIYMNFCCVVFHMTDLPYGRGGSPLQNLIIRKVYNTKISAIKVTADIDAGNVYMKRDFSIKEGSAGEILMRMSNVIFFEMIPTFLEGGIEDTPQVGTVTVFTRRKPEESRITEFMSISQMYDFIRMLDGEGYPKAFLNVGDMRFEFSHASEEDGKVKAIVEITNIGGE